MLERIVSVVNDIVWSPVLVVLLVGAGLYFSVRTRFVQLRRIGLMVRLLFRKRDKEAGAEGVSSFEAFCIALSGRVGTGNIVGVATAIALGGPGSVFWMWVIAFFGASTAFMESTLAQLFRFSHPTGYRGGPACYIDKGLHARPLAIIYALFTILATSLMLPTVQANGMATAVQNSFGINPLISGVFLAFLLGLVIVGGIKRIAKAAALVTPFMALIYIGISLLILALNWRAVPGLLSLIVRNAFGINPLCGGILGSTIMMGVKRGLFSNEAGQGTGAIPSASADVKHPAEQGLVQAFSVYVDTLLVCTATALMILSAGTYNVLGSDGSLLFGGAPELGANYVGFTQAAVDTVLGGFGGPFVSIALTFFVFTTLMAYYFYSESSIIYLCQGSPRAEKFFVRVLQALILAAIVFGSAREANLVWTLGDIGVGIMAWVNVAAILILAPRAVRALREYEGTLRR
jgi:AGCS family alanine or glycine:cation symporter